MEFKPSAREDISRYYRGTYVKLMEYGDQLFLIESVDSLRVAGRHESGDPFVIYMDEATPYTMDYILPHKSFFQLGQYATLLQRIPAKMYYRGLCESNTEMSYLNAVASPKRVDLTFENLKAFVSKQPFFTLQKAINAGDLTSCVLNSRMMYLRPRKELYIDHVMIAKVNTGKLVVTMHQPIFTDEVKEFLAHTGEDKVFSVESYVPPAPKQKLKPEDLVAELEGQKQEALKAKLKKKYAAQMQAPQFGLNLFGEIQE